MGAALFIFLLLTLSGFADDGSDRERGAIDIEGIELIEKGSSFPDDELLEDEESEEERREEGGLPGGRRRWRASA